VAPPMLSLTHTHTHTHTHAHAHTRRATALGKEVSEVRGATYVVPDPTLKKLIGGAKMADATTQVCVCVCAVCVLCVWGGVCGGCACACVCVWW
jgi:hypothetical protein